MKLLLLTQDFPPKIGGIQTLLYENVKRLSGERIVITKYVQSCEEYDKKEDFRIIRKKSNLVLKILMSLIGRVYNFMPFYLEFRSLIEKVVKKEHIDAIICGHIFTALVAYNIHKKYGIPYIIYAHGQELFPTGIGKRYYKNVLKKILKNASIIYVISNFTKNLILPFVSNKEKVKKINLVGVDINRFKPLRKNKKLLKRLGLEGRYVLLTVSRLEAYKGIDFVILALKKVLKRIPNLAYVIIGEGEDKQRLFSLVRRAGLKRTVIFVGEVGQKEIVDFYNLCDVFILNSRDCLKRSKFCPIGGRVEGFGLVFLEANACGKPVIGGNSGGVPDAVMHGKTGLLVNPTNINDIVNAIIKLFRDKKYASQLGRDGRMRVLKYYNYDFGVRAIEGDLKGLTSK